MEGLKAVTFDCFGTLVDWKLGQGRVLRQFPSLEAATDTDLDKIMALREEMEIDLQAGPWMPYSEVLESSIGRAAQGALSLKLTGSECRAFSAGQPGWPLFPDSSSALGRLAAAGLKIGLLSNCDRRILERTARAKLRLSSALCVSSEELRSYKPASAHWGAALAAWNLKASQVLHVSFSPFHDLEPAHGLGFPLGFVARYGGHAPKSLPLKVEAPDLEYLVGRILA